jgi:predicted TIM-barrel enzyme
MARFERAALMKKFHAMAARGEPIVGGGQGSDFPPNARKRAESISFVIYNSGRYRMAGRGSLAGLLAYGDANAIVLEMAGEVLPVVKKTPVLAGVNGTDPFRDMDVFLDQIKAIGFAGVQNFPTVGLIDGILRANLEETGMGYALEVDMIGRARAKDLLTTPYVFCESEAEAMAQAGADIVVCHLGLTTGGAIGAATAQKLEDCPALIDAWAGAALRVRPNILVLAHGGPIAEPADADFIMKTCKVCHGFYGASSTERLPVERALTEQVRRFKVIGRKS